MRVRLYAVVTILTDGDGLCMTVVSSKYSFDDTRHDILRAASVGLQATSLHDPRILQVPVYPIVNINVNPLTLDLHCARPQSFVKDEGQYDLSVKLTRRAGEA
ncbi:uncharacterized protein ARMOST_21039 [Armillaria ostoyae]|uniref:Uncharacterized protein n=1 Tax=Armillaria ostoyae TaxID=47428 RepID=A0A284S8Z9_ARMOS|nr:uncharacterized protein ARMOST_21039 [Armillaria ostoyae]